MNPMINCWVALVAVLWLGSTMTLLEGMRPIHNQEPSEAHGWGEAAKGKRWAVLVAGSAHYFNYRHQADVCHAYQILKKGGLEDENIIVFMYDDIALNEENPRPGVIINKPNGPNVYVGVPKDYTGEDANAKNLYAVISGDRSALQGGSGKVVDSGPDDIIFIYYTDHGGPGMLSMPVGDNVLAQDLVDILKKKHAAQAYKKMVIYVEACEAGSMFEGLLPNDINIYVTTASNANENSYAAYCPHSSYSPPPEYNTCLGDVYSISWMEDSDKNDLTKESLGQQYETVRRRTLYGTVGIGSHVKQYGDLKLRSDFLVTYIGAKPISVNDNYILNSIANANSTEIYVAQTRLVNQRDAHLLYLSQKLKRAQDGSNEKIKAQKELDAEIAHRENVDSSFRLIGDLLFGEEKSTEVMAHLRQEGQPLVDDWDCFKTMIKTYESHCGRLSGYGMKYTRAFANICNAKISVEQMAVASSQACSKENHAS